jgi:hypothetical protein
MNTARLRVVFQPQPSKGPGERSDAAWSFACVRRDSLKFTAKYSPRIKSATGPKRCTLVPSRNDSCRGFIPYIWNIPCLPAVIKGAGGSSIGLLFRIDPDVLILTGMQSVFPQQALRRRLSAASNAAVQVRNGGGRNEIETFFVSWSDRNRTLYDVLCPIWREWNWHWQFWKLIGDIFSAKRRI